MSVNALWFQCALTSVLLANCLPPSTCLADSCVLQDGEAVKPQEDRSLLQQDVRRSSYQSPSVIEKQSLHAIRLNNFEGPSDDGIRVSLPGEGAGLRKFWLIAISSYFISALFTISICWWFCNELKLPADDLEEEQEEEEDVATCSINSSVRAVARAEAEDMQETVAIAPMSWRAGTEEERLKIAALTSFILSSTMGVYAFLRFFHRPDCAPFRPYVHIPEMCVLVGMIVLTACCWIKPRTYLYWPALALLFLYIPAVALPPFNMSCAILQSKCRDDEHWRISQAVNHVDCSLQGQTAQQIFLTVFLLLPWLLPDLKYFYLIVVWTFSVYIVWSVAYLRYSEDSDLAFGSLDVVTRTILLACTLFISVMKKFYVEKSQRNKYLSGVARRQESLRLYNILEFMLPEHVIVRLLSKPGETIADSIDEVSVLFIVIDDFESIVRTKSPELLLRFLNQYFTKFDAICRHYGVQKIETVGEEYVCCVGVSPSDIEESKRNGHESIIRNLFKAAGAILHLQTDTVKFKMGMHTGPIVAGVIAQKLPRFRLFGDSINTAARMMQKGKVGMLQFGEESHRHIPLDMKCEPRGEIEMKGKGKVKTFLFSPPVRQSTVVTNSQSFDDDDSPTHVDAESKDDAGGLLSVLLNPQQRLDREQEQGEKKKKSQSLRRSAKTGSQMNFKDIVTEVTGTSEKEGVYTWSTEMEEEFRTNYHQFHTIKKIEQRLQLQFLGIFILSVLELLWNIPSPADPNAGWARYHDVVGTWARRPIFIVSRVVALSIIAALRYAVTSREWARKNPQFQNWLVASSCVIAVALFVSYDVLITGSSPTKPPEERRVRVLAPFDQIFSLVFIILFFFICSGHKVLFKQSLAFVPLAVLLVLFANIRSHCGIYFPVIGQVLFVVIAISFAALAHSHEKSLRANYEAMHATRTTKDRVEAILRTMMPPMVLEQVQASPSSTRTVHHQYEMATIAQSDLCGFTKIASTLKPTEVVQFISELFGMFDELTDAFGIYKVETVGDAYIGGQAEFPLTKQNSPTSVIQFGIAMISEVIRWSKRCGMDVHCRVGVHHGSCIGGIVDKEMQRYHIFGELMQVMEILESTAPEGSVQVSAACREAVLRERKTSGQVEKPELQFKEREEEHLVTSKGEVHHFEATGGRTFLLQGRALQRGGTRELGLHRANTKPEER